MERRYSEKSWGQKWQTDVACGIQQSDVVRQESDELFARCVRNMLCSREVDGIERSEGRLVVTSRSSHDDRRQGDDPYPVKYLARSPQPHGVSAPDCTWQLHFDEYR